MWTVAGMNRKYDDGFQSYDSLRDPHLAGYFKRPNVRSHLVKAGLINQFGQVVPNVSKSISQQRKAQLRQLLTEAINSMKRTRSEENPEVILTHLSSKLTSLEELKQLENMLRAYLVLEAKKSYTRKPFTGYSELRRSESIQEALPRTKIQFADPPPRPGTFYVPTPAAKYKVGRNFASGSNSCTYNWGVTSANGSRSTPVSPLPVVTSGHLASNLRSHEQPRPPSTYGLRRRHSYGTTLTSAKVSKVNTSSSSSARQVGRMTGAGGDHNSHRSLVKEDNSTVNGGTIDGGKNRAKRTVTILTDEKSGTSHPRSNGGQTVDKDDSYNGSDVDFVNDILSLSGDDSWSLSSSSPSYCFSDCPSFYSPRLQSTATAPQVDDLAHRRGASNYRHQSSSPFTAPHPHPHPRKAANSISPHFYQRHTAGPCCISRQSNSNINILTSSSIPNSSSSFINSSKLTRTGRGVSVNRKIASAIITLKYEPNFHLPKNKKAQFNSTSNNTSSMKLVKIYQQISRGSASFLVCARYINPGSTFKFTVYRREKISNSFSLSIFFDSIRETRISSCCEFKHQPGTKISLNLTIVNIKSLLDPSDEICETCVKGILWCEWLGKSLTSKSKSKPEVEIYRPPGKESNENGDEKGGGGPNGDDDDVGDDGQSGVSSPVLSEKDYKEELRSYSRHNRVRQVENKKSKSDAAQGTRDAGGGGSKDEEEEEKEEVALVSSREKMPATAIEKHQGNSEIGRRKESLKGKNEVASEKSRTARTTTTTKREEEEEDEDATATAAQASSCTSSTSASAFTSTSNMNSHKRQVQMQLMLNSSEEGDEREKAKMTLSKKEPASHSSGSSSQKVTDESASKDRSDLKVNESTADPTYGQSSFEEETETDAEKLEGDADGEDTEDEPATLVL